MSVPAAHAFPWRRVAVLWAVLCALLLLVNAGAIAERRFYDADDMLRLVQIRDLLAGQGWFDIHQYRIDPPEGVAMHWSRLPDIPLAAVILLLTPLVGAASAEMAALVFVPLVTLGVVVAVVARVSSRFFVGDETTFACLALGLSPTLVAQVLPLRIDHHGWQVACVMVALLGLLPGRGTRGAALSGAALGVGLTISLEPLPIVAGYGLVFGWRWLMARDPHSLPAFLGALATTLAALFLATRGVADLAAYCDTISPPYIALLAVVTALTSLVARLRPRSPVGLIGLLALAGGGGLAVFLALAPQCSAGPFGALDPLVQRLWYENVLEGMPAWSWPPALAVPVVLAGAAALAVLAHLARNRPPAERQWWLEYLAVASVAWCTALLVWRSQAFVGGLSAVPLGWLTVRLLAQLRQAGAPGRKLVAGLAIVPVLTPGFPTAAAGALGVESEVSKIQMQKVSDSACELDRMAPRLDGLPAATIFAPLDVGPVLVERSHHSVVATGHHRANAAIRDVMAAFIGSPDEARGLIRRHGARYVMLCADLGEPRLLAREAPDGFVAGLVAGRVPDWLEPVDLGTPPAFRLWRVRE